MDKMDFKGALDGLDNVVCDITAIEWFEKWSNHTDSKLNPIAQALRIADRLQSGEVSDGMLNVAGNGKPNCEVFQAMAEQLIKECKDDKTK